MQAKCLTAPIQNPQPTIRRAGQHWLLGLVIVLAANLFFLPQAMAADAGYVARLVGNIKIDGNTAKRGDTFGSGATLSTGDKSYALIKFSDGQRTFLKANSQLVVEEYNFDPQQPKKSTSALKLLKGGIRTVSGLIAKQNREAVRYETPTVTMGVRGTEFMLSIVNGQLFIHVLSGAIGFTPPLDGIDTLEAGGYLAISELGDVIASGAEARDTAERAGAFQQMNTTDVDSSFPDPTFQWQGIQIDPLGEDPISPVGNPDIDFIEDTTPPAGEDAQPSSKGYGVFERLE